MKRPGGDENEHQPKVSKFKLMPRAKPKPVAIPKAHELQRASMKEPVVLPPPHDIAAKMTGFDIIIGIDIETHDWESRSNVPGGPGRHGFYTICHPDDFLVRVVQIGWAIGGASAHDPVVKEYTVKPDGYVIADKAAKYHKISNERANAEGKPLVGILCEFMDDVRAAVAKGGRVVAHNLECFT
jgi:hypothetical protein